MNLMQKCKVKHVMETQGHVIHSQNAFQTLVMTKYLVK